MRDERIKGRLVVVVVGDKRKKGRRREIGAGEPNVCVYNPLFLCQKIIAPSLLPPRLSSLLEGLHGKRESLLLLPLRSLSQFGLQERPRRRHRVRSVEKEKRAWKNPTEGLFALRNPPCLLRSFSPFPSPQCSGLTLNKVNGSPSGD